jgi:uncharacterized protein (TIGR02453 family)
MNLQLSQQFLSELKNNNNREWFNDNKEKYLEAKEEFAFYIDSLIPKIKEFDADIDVFSSQECVFRIFRDVRFSKDKSPYKPNFGAFIARGGRKSPFAGYYIHIEKGESFLGGGVYQPQPPALFAIRNAIYENPSKFKKILKKPEFAARFKSLYGEKLKNGPRGFDKDFPDLEFLKHKHFIVTSPVEDSSFNAMNSQETVLDIMKVQMPFNHYLNQIILTTL